MGCTTSHDAFAAAVRTRATRRADPAALCRERALLIRAAADRRFALAAAHAAYFRSLAAVGDALRRFATAALAPATPSPVLMLPPSPAKQVAASATVSSLPPSPSSSSTVSPLSHSISDEDLEVPDAGASDRASSSTRHHHHHYMRRSPTVPNVVYEDPDAQPQYTQGDVTYGYGYAYPYGPYGEPVTEEIRPETTAPPSPPTAETSSPWDFFDPFTTYDHFMADYSGGNFPTNSPNYAELKKMEGIPELEDEAELEADASKPSTSTVADQNAKGKGPIPENPSVAKLQRKGSGSAPGADDGEVGKLASRNDSVPSNASSKSKDEGAKKSSATMKATTRVDIEGTSSSNGKKKSVAFDEEDSIRPAGGGDGGESHGKSVQSAVSSESFSPLHHGTRDVMEAMGEIKEQFDQAANCGTEVSRLLEVGKVPSRSTPGVLTCG
jgi:hypothetical protein